MYRFCSPSRILNDLSVSGSGDELLFSTDTETAIVKLEPYNIAEVVHRDLVKKTEVVIPSRNAHHIVVGEGNCTRDVYHYLKPNPHSHLQIRLGITVHRGEGTWSSLPHPFELRPEKGFEEVFFYMLKGGSGRAIQVGSGLWADGSPVETCWQVFDRSFSTIPMGYHPVGAEPGVQVRYVWAYLVKKPAWEKI